MFNTNAQYYQNISQVLLTSAFILWPTCTRGFGIREKIRCGLRFFGVFLCGFAVFGPPLRPPRNPFVLLHLISIPHWLMNNRILQGKVIKMEDFFRGRIKNYGILRGQRFQPWRFYWESPDLMCCLLLSGFLSDCPNLSWRSEDKEKIAYLKYSPSQHCVLCWLIRPAVYTEGVECLWQ